MVDYEKNITQKLIQAWKKGNFQSIEELWERKEPFLFIKFFSKTNSVHDTEDLLHETFIRMCQNIQNLNYEEKFDAWLNKISENLLNDFFRNKQRQFSTQKLLEKKTDFQTDQEINSQEWEINKLFTCMEQLTKEEQEIIELRYYQKQTLKELGNKFGFSPEGIRKKLAKIVSKLEEYMKKQVSENT